MSEHQDQLAVCLEKWRQVDKHFEESIPVRETVWQLKLRVEILEQSVTRNAIIGGLIGALIGSGASPAVIKLVELFFGR